MKNSSKQNESSVRERERGRVREKREKNQQ